MYKILITAQAKNGKAQEAIENAKGIAEYFNGKYPAKVEVYMQEFGAAGTIYWMVDYKDLATIESINAQLMSDQGYWATINKASDSWIEGSVNFTLVRSI